MPLERVKKEPKTRDELARSRFNVIKNQHQNKVKLAAGDISADDLWVRAYELADKMIEARIENLKGKSESRVDLMAEIQEFRETQEQKYRELYDWNDANDETTLKNILDNESNTFEVKRSLQDPTLPMDLKDKMYDRHTKLTLAHRDLLNAAGIDRLSREKKVQSAQPMDDWERVKEAAERKMETLKVEFLERAEKATSEMDLRDQIKYCFGYDFEGIVDPMLINHRRVLGLPLELSKNAD